MEEQTINIGTPGTPWGSAEKAIWLQQQRIQRSYQEEVLDPLFTNQSDYQLCQYGVLKYASGEYPLYAAKSLSWSNDKPLVLITGGVHGYETSGVQGALRFLQTKALDYSAHFNIVVAPCISPWGYETINRWNPDANDPNRNFAANTTVPESAQIMAFVASINMPVLAHIDLHETTDSDNTEFRPLLAARDGIVQDNWNIPDGFYLVGDTNKPVPDFQKAIVDSVAKVTHIAPPDDDGKFIGVTMEQAGVINYPTRKLGLCAGFTDAEYVSTTEVYPDSPRTNPEECIVAQVAAITGGLDYLLKLLAQQGA